MTININININFPYLVTALAEIRKDIATMAGTLDDVKAVADRLVGDVKRASDDIAKILAKLDEVPVPPDMQPIIDELTAASDALEAAATEAESRLTP